MIKRAEGGYTADQIFYAAYLKELTKEATFNDF